MFIEIEELKQEPLHVRHVYQKDELPFSHEDATIGEPVTANFVLTHRETNLHIDGTVETTIGYKCSRCLKEGSQAINTRFELSYLPQPKLPEGTHEIELKYDDMDVGFYDGIRFDVNLMVLEQIELSIPMRFICREDCKGLCPVCGADLNEQSCACKTTDTDSRLAALLEFRTKKKNH